MSIQLRTDTTIAKRGGRGPADGGGSERPRACSVCAPGTISTWSLWLALGAIGAVAPAAAETWETECASEPERPEIEQVIGPIPQPGKWRGKGFGDKRKVDVDIEQCGLKITGLVGVRLKGNVPKMVDLERDLADGRYKASFFWAEGGGGATVTWDLEAESTSRIRGRMSIMGRSDQVEADLLEPGPALDLAACECAAVRDRRNELSDTLASLEDPARAEDTLGPDWGFVTDPETCSIERDTLDRTLPTQESLEVLMRADWEGELIHRAGCCEAHASNAQTSRRARVPEHVAAVTARIELLDDWLAERCLDD